MKIKLASGKRNSMCGCNYIHCILEGDVYISDYIYVMPTERLSQRKAHIFSDNTLFTLNIRVLHKCTRFSEI